MDMKKGLKGYFGAGKKIPVPSKEGTPILMVVKRREGQGNTPRGNSGDKIELIAQKEGEGDNDNTVRSMPNAKKGTKALRKESSRNAQVRQQRI